MMSYLEASLRWHRIIAIDADSKVLLQEINQHEQNRGAQFTPGKRSRASLKRSLPKISLPVELHYPQVVPNEHNETSKRQKVDKIFDHLSVDEAPMQYGTGKIGYEVMRGTSRIPAESSRELQRALCKLLRTDDATFTCQSQKDAVFECLKGRDDLVVCMGTGSGKSLIFQLTAEMERGSGILTIVIVPLVALLEDQLRRCRDLNIPAARWSERERHDYSILFVPVEHVRTPSFQELVSSRCQRGNPPRIVSDECHLSSQWSEFRPAMLRLENSLHHPSMPIQRVLLSATIPPLLTSRIAMQHGLLSGYRELREKTTRMNLAYCVISAEKTRFQSAEDAVIQTTIANVLREVGVLAKRDRKHSTGDREFSKHQVVLYVPFRNMVAAVTDMLSSELDKVSRRVLPEPGRNGISNQRESTQAFYEFVSDETERGLLIVATPMTYYATMELEAKQRTHRIWMSDAEKIRSTLHHRINASVHVTYVQVMVATSAFGIGIDSPDVRLVFHVGFCRSLLDYSQESGRAGRDGNLAKCITVYNEAFANTYASTISSEVPDSVSQIGKGTATAFETRDRQTQMASQMALSQFRIWARSADQCRRVALSAFLDETRCEECVVNRISHPCDFCRSIMTYGLEKNSIHSKKGFKTNERPGLSMHVVRKLPEPMVDTVDEPVGTTLEIASVIPDLKTGTIMELHGSSARSQIALVAAKKDVFKRLALFHDQIEHLRNKCVLCYSRDKTLHEESAHCIKKASACFKCLRPRCGSAFCPTLSRRAHVGAGRDSFASVIDGKANLEVRSLAGFRSTTSRNQHTQSAQVKAKSKPSLCWDCHMPLYFKTLRLHKGDDFGGKKCLVRKTVQLLLLFWRQMDLRSDLISTFALKEDWNNDDIETEGMFLSWLSEMDNGNESLNLMSVTNLILG